MNAGQKLHPVRSFEPLDESANSFQPLQGGVVAPQKVLGFLGCLRMNCDGGTSASVTVAGDEMPFYSLENMLKSLSIRPIPLLLEREVERLACDLQEISQLLNLKQCDAVAWQPITTHQSENRCPSRGHRRSLRGHLHLISGWGTF